MSGAGFEHDDRADEDWQTVLADSRFVTGQGSLFSGWRWWRGAKSKERRLRREVSRLGLDAEILLEFSQGRRSAPRCP